MFTEIVEALERLTFGLPAEAWWMAGVALAILGATAAVDGWSGRIPDMGIFFGLMLTLAVRGVYGGWDAAAMDFFVALLVAALIYGANQLYYRWRKRDALGMGDAKWTALAVMNFGLKPVAVAWGVGAWLGLFWLLGLWTVRKLRRQQMATTKIHFAPFLFLGLLAGLYGLYLR